MFVRLLLFALAFAVVNTSAAEARILKVLPHLLDAKGRNALAPSLFERDAYQEYLRRSPAEVSAIRFDVQYKTRSKQPLVLRMEIRGSKMDLGRSRIFETDLQPRGVFSKWGRLQLDKQTYEEIGTVIAWRATLRRGGEIIASQESFLW